MRALLLGLLPITLASCASPPPAPAPAAAAPAPVAEAHHGTSSHAMPHRFDDAQKWAAVFDDPARDAWQKPDEVVKALALAPTATVADVGAGTGYFTVRLARAVPQGRVLGIDVEPNLVAHLKARAAKEGLTNVEGIVCPPDDAALPGPVDLVLVVDTLHHLSDRVAYFARVKQKLAPGGRVAIIDFKMDASFGPPKEHRLSREVIEREMAQAGLALAASHDFLPEQVFLVFTAVEPAPRAEQRASPSDPRVARARVAADQLRTSLLDALMSSIKNNGTAKSIDVCKSAAPALTRALAKDGITIGRTSSKLRNKDNAPRPWVAPLLKKMEALPADQRGPLTFGLTEGAIGVVLPIVTAQPCLQCHGAELAPDVKAALAAAYPEDQATGFKEGDLRGVFWVELR